MRRVAPLIVAALALTLAAPAGAKGPTLKSLQAQITVLQKKVKKLQAAQKVDRNIAVAGIVYTGCTAAATADALQGTWMTVDGYVTGAGHAALFGTQTPVNDYQVCSQGFNIVRQKSAVPPSVAVIQAVLDFFFKP
jgi:hypothetical protein